MTAVSMQGIDLPDRKQLTFDAAERVVEAALSAARADGLRVSIAVLDDGGHLMRFVRMDGIHPGTVAVAQAKASTAFLFRRPTRGFAEAVAAGQTGLLALPGVLPFPGGLPLFGGGAVVGAIVGAIGVSGATPDQDEQIAAAGAAVLAKEPT